MTDLLTSGTRSVVCFIPKIHHNNSQVLWKTVWFFLIRRKVIFTKPNFIIYIYIYSVYKCGHLRRSIVATFDKLLNLKATDIINWINLLFFNCNSFIIRQIVTSFRHILIYIYIYISKAWVHSIAQAITAIEIHSFITNIE